MRYFAFLITFLAAACQSPEGVQFGTMSEQEYLVADEEAQRAELARYDRVETLMPLWERKYLAGEKFNVGGQWVHRHPVTGYVTTWPEHDPDGPDGPILGGMYMTLSDPTGKLMFNTDPKTGNIAPITLLAVTAAQDDIGKDLAKAALGGFFNGSMAAIINKRLPGVDSCDNCGTSIQNFVQSGASSNSSVDDLDIKVGR